MLDSISFLILPHNKYLHLPNRYIETLARHEDIARICSRVYTYTHKCDSHSYSNIIARVHAVSSGFQVRYTAFNLKICHPCTCSTELTLKHSETNQNRHVNVHSCFQCSFRYCMIKVITSFC